jgi:hypothetical protein
MRVAIVFSACLAVAPAIRADDSPVSRAAHAIESEIRQYGRDVKAEVKAPAGWTRREWEWAGLSVVTIGALMHEDQHFASQIQSRRSHSTDSFARAITPFGGGRAQELAVAMIVIGAATHHDDLRDTGRDAFEAELIAAGLITPLLKRGFGRARPNQDELTSHDFDPGVGRQESFPSGHATNAFAFASAVAAHSNGWIIPTIAYSIASGVAAARLNTNVHWSSDVFAGALIGAATGRFIVHRHQKAHRENITLVPLIAPRTAGLSLRVVAW